MKGFNWDEFKKGNMAVKCSTNELAKSFLSECSEQDLRWQVTKRSAVRGAESDIYDKFKSDTHYAFDIYDDEISFDRGDYYRNEGYKVIEWALDETNNNPKYALMEDYRIEVDEENRTITVIDNREKKPKFYIGGSLFSEAEVNQRLKEEKELRELGFDNIYNPISADVNDKNKLPTSADIFKGDTIEILSSDVVVADLSNQTDLGVACEMGIIWACNFIHRLAKDGLNLEKILGVMKEKKVVAHLSDIRKSTSHLYKGNHIPFGYNQFMLACVEDVGVVKDNFKEVLDELKGVK